MRLISKQTVGAAVIASGLIPGVIGLRGLVAVVSGSQLLQIAVSVLTVIVGLFVSFGIWRLASGLRGATALKFSFVAQCLVVAAVPVLVAVYAVFGGRVGDRAQGNLVLLPLWVPSAFGYIASVLLVVGLMISALVPAEVAWLVAASTLLDFSAQLIYWPASASQILHPAAMGALAGPSGFPLWVIEASWVLGPVSAVILGVALIFGRGTRPHAEAMPQVRAAR